MFLFLVSVELEELSKSELESVFVSDPSHKVCQQQLRQLKEEFERYKVKTQALHKNKSFKELSEQLENLEKLKGQNEELEKQLQELKDTSNERELDQKKVITNLRDQLKLMEKNHKHEKEESNTVYKQKLEELERQVLNQRERTLALVAEKDSEIEMLRSRSPSASPSAESGAARSAFSYQRKFVEITGSTQASLDSPQDSEADAAVHQLLSKPSRVSAFNMTNFIGPWYHAALLFSGLGSIVLLFVLLFSQQIREDLVRATYRLDINAPPQSMNML